MILVDTNVWSELTRATPNEQVRAWEKANAPDLWLSTAVIGELLSGAHRLPDGKRKTMFLDGYDQLVVVHADRIASFDLAAARHCGAVLAFQERNGRDPGTADTQIAATALARGMALATRNVKRFHGLGLHVIDPWQV